MASGNVVVWSWQNDFGHWEAYDANVSNYIEQNKSKRHVDLRNIDPGLAAYRVDTVLLTQTRVNTGVTRQVQRALYPANLPVSKGVTWQWESGPGQWHAYNMDAQNLLETACMNNQLQVDLSQPPVNMPYSVDLTTMQQVRQITGFIRSVRRTTQVPYINDQGSAQAGMVRHQSAPPQGAGTFGSVYGTLGSVYGPHGQTAATGPASVPTTTVPGVATRSMTKSASVGHTPNYNPFSSVPSTSLTIGASASGFTAPTGSLKSGPSKSGSRHRATQQNMSRNPYGEIEIKAGTGGGHEAKDVLQAYSNMVPAPDPAEECAICLDAMGWNLICQLNRCKHFFHQTCLASLYNSGTKSGSLQCPICKAMYGHKTGNCPAGTMSYQTISHSLPGHGDCDTIQITYSIWPGIQGQEHAQPGQPYIPQAFPRVGYLPNNERGRKVLALLIEAWKRRLIFTIGTSVTTGQTNCVVWNEIHHKTELHGNSSGHGYPDPAYLDNVIHELSLQGVTEDT